MTSSDGAPADYTAAELDCRGCMGPCGRCEDLALRAEIERDYAEALVEAIKFLRWGGFLGRCPAGKMQFAAGPAEGLSPVGRRFREHAADRLEAELEAYLRGGEIAVRTELELKAMLRTFAAEVKRAGGELERAAAALKKAGAATAASRAHVAGLEVLEIAESMAG